MERAAHELRRGDQVIQEDGDTLIVKAVIRGMMKNSVHIEYTNGAWSEVHKNENVLLQA